MRSALIIGVGQFGSHIAKRMSKLHCEVMAVDLNEERINAILPYVTNAQIGDSTNAAFMESLGISDFDVCIVTISGNFQNSLETTALLKELGAKNVISRAQNDVQQKFLLRNGADETVYPEKLTAIRLATRAASDSILDYIQMDKNLSIYEMRVPREWEGKNLIELDIRKKYQLNIIALRTGKVLTLPTPNTELHEGDDVLVIGSLRDIQKCFKL